MKTFKKIVPDKQPDTLLPLKNAHRDMAYKFIIGLVCNKYDKVNIQEKVGMYLRDSEYQKVSKEINKVLKQLQKKIDKSNDKDLNI